MQKVCWPYFDPEFDSLAERIYGPSCSVSIDNDSLEDCTMVKVDSVNKQDLLLEVVQVLTDMNLVISKGYISSDSSWFMDVLHVKDAHGNKLKDQRVIDYIQKPHSEHTAIEMTGPDRPGLFSEISAALTDLHCNVVEAHAWSHNARLACIAYISDQSTDSPIDGRRLAAIEGHLATVLRATTTPSPDWHEQEVKTAGLPEGDGTMTTVERRLHQLMLSVRDFDRPTQSPGTPTMALGSNPGDEKERKATVKVENCDEKGYSIVTVRCWDRPRLMFDTVCTLIDMQYVISHASVDSRAGFAFQEYFIRHIDGNAMNTESEKERVIKCLEAALERRVCEGVRLELRAKSRVGLLSDITRVLRENGLVVLRADIATQGEKVDHAFYIRDVSGNEVDMEFVESMKKEILGPIDLAVKKTQVPPSSPPKTPLSSITDKLKYQIERLICL
ncbi:[Protein-PII] uridylyltransferase [Bertholletia excelsa]